PPILYKLHKHAISNYSKAPRGLSVQSRVMRIFTHSIISPGLSLRQCPSRCTFRAGRNLPDKEFRYLRTVIVTDRKSTRLNSSHVSISYAVFCLKNKKPHYTT